MPIVRSDDATVERHVITGRPESSATASSSFIAAAFIYRHAKSRGPKRETDRRAPTDATTSSDAANFVTACTSRQKTRVRHTEQHVPPVVRKITLLSFVVQALEVKAVIC
jgi:hypothetical protein